jgi:hypothetical protein
VDLAAAKAEIEATQRAIRYEEEDQQRQLEEHDDGDGSTSIN